MCSLCVCFCGVCMYMCACMYVVCVHKHTMCVKSVCMCVMYVYVWLCVYVYVCVITCECAFECVHVRVCICACVCLCVVFAPCTHVCMCAFVRMWEYYFHNNYHANSIIWVLFLIDIPRLILISCTHWERYRGCECFHHYCWLVWQYILYIAHLTRHTPVRRVERLCKVQTPVLKALLNNVLKQSEMDGPTCYECLIMLSCENKSLWNYNLFPMNLKIFMLHDSP